MLLDGRAVARSGSVPQYFLSSKRHSWLRRNAPILNVDVLLQRDKNSALTNAASPTGWEMPASANIRAVPGNGWLLCNQTEKEDRHENHLQCVDSFGGAVGMGPASVPAQAEQQRASRAAHTKRVIKRHGTRGTRKTPLPRIKKPSRHGIRPASRTLPTIRERQNTRTVKIPAMPGMKMKRAAVISNLTERNHPPLPPDIS